MLVLHAEPSLRGILVICFSNNLFDLPGTAAVFVFQTFLYPSLHGTGRQPYSPTYLHQLRLDAVGDYPGRP